MKNCRTCICLGKVNGTERCLMGASPQNCVYYHEAPSSCQPQVICMWSEEVTTALLDVGLNNLAGASITVFSTPEHPQPRKAIVHTPRPQALRRVYRSSLYTKLGKDKWEGPRHTLIVLED